MANWGNITNFDRNANNAQRGGEREMKEFNLTISIYQAEDGKWWVWIGNENGAGGEYPANNPKELGEAISFYISAYCQS